METPITPETHGQLSCLNWRTLSDHRAASIRPNGNVMRAALIMTGKCNFACPYCKTLGGDRAPSRKKDEAIQQVQILINRGLKELRLSGGEPTVVPWLHELVSFAHKQGVRVAVSTNGYANPEIYKKLIEAGVAEFSISLDSVDPDEADLLSGGKTQVLKRVLATIKLITSMGKAVYIGMTCCSDRGDKDKMNETIKTVASLNVTDVKIMSLAQEGAIPDTSWMTKALEEKFPFLSWRAHNFQTGRDVRGLKCGDSCKCALVLDDVTIAGGHHFPCNVYFREGGQPIGKTGTAEAMLRERAEWYKTHDSLKDPICSTMCMDLLRTYNNRVQEINPDLK